MSRQKIKVTFNPTRGTDDSLSFSPERAVLEGETATVDVILHTVGCNGSKARFAEPEAILWITEGPQDLKQAVNSSRTILSLRGFPMVEEQETIDYGYAVTVEYEGETYSSTSQYPVMSCVDIGGGGGG